MPVELTNEEIQESLGKIKIPSTPAVLGELNEVVQQENPDIGKVADVIGRDIAIAAMVLKTVNSAFFGLKHRVNSIRHATSLLGLINIRNIVAGLALKNALEVEGEFSSPEFWDSPVNVALIATMLAQHYDVKQPDEAYLLGLFQDAGEVLMMRRFGESYIATLHEARVDGINLVELENDRYATNHAVVAYYISSGWGLPRRLCNIIHNHHDTSFYLQEEGGAVSQERTLMAVLKMAEHIDACFWGREGNSEWMRHGDAVLDYLGLDSTEFFDLKDEMIELLLEKQQ